MSKVLKGTLVLCTIVTTLLVGGVVAKATTYSDYTIAYGERVEGELVVCNSRESYADTTWQHKGNVYTWAGASNSQWGKIDQAEGYGYYGFSSTRVIETKDAYCVQSRHSARLDNNIYVSTGNDFYNEDYR